MAEYQAVSTRAGRIRRLIWLDRWALRLLRHQHRKGLHLSGERAATAML
jgi:hypothetical protein